MRRASLAALSAVAIGLSVVACSSSGEPTECVHKDGASLCLVNHTSTVFSPEATGLAPRSAVTVEMSSHAQSGSASESAPSGGLHADGSGHLSSTGHGIVVPAGQGQETITVIATTARGTPIAASFVRGS
jgi:hypothetical protein